jgi:hypothetical protein
MAPFSCGEVVDANRLNVQLLAAVPAFGLVFAGAKLGAKLWFAVRTRRVRSAGAVLADAGLLLNDLERLLVLDDGALGGSDALDDGSGSDGSGSSSSAEALSAEGLGELCVSLHRYQGLLDTAAISSRGVPKLLRSSAQDAKHVRTLPMSIIMKQN